MDVNNAVESSKSSVLITDTNKIKSNKRNIQNAGLIPSWYKVCSEYILKVANNVPFKQS